MRACVKSCTSALDSDAWHMACTSFRKCGLFLIFYTLSSKCSRKIFLAINSFASCDAVGSEKKMNCTLHKFIFKNLLLLVLTVQMRFRAVSQTCAIQTGMHSTQQTQMHVLKRKFRSFTPSLQKIRIREKKYRSFTSLLLCSVHFFPLSFIFCNLCRNKRFSIFNLENMRSFLQWRLIFLFFRHVPFSSNRFESSLQLHYRISIQKVNVNPDKMIIKTKNRQNAFFCSLASFGKHFVRFYI